MSFCWYNAGRGKAVTALFAGIALLMMAGCSTIPKPPRDGRAVDFKAIKVGSTSRVEVIQEFGQPSASFEQGGILTYRIVCGQEDSTRYVILRYPIGGWARVKYSLVLTFDAQDILDKCSFVEVKEE